MDQLLLDIHKPAKKTIKNFVIGNNAECINSLNKFLGQVKGAGKRLVRLNDKAEKMSKMGLSIDVKDHEINKLDLDDQSAVNKESDK